MVQNTKQTESAALHMCILKTCDYVTFKDHEGLKKTFRDLLEVEFSVLRSLKDPNLRFELIPFSVCFF